MPRKNIRKTNKKRSYSPKRKVAKKKTVKKFSKSSIAQYIKLVTTDGEE